MNSMIDDPALARDGADRMRWFRTQMPLIAHLQEKFTETKPFSGMNLAVCMHVEPKTAFWIETLLAGGAEHIDLVGCLGTTKPDTAAYLADNPRITVMARVGDTLETHHGYCERAMERQPRLLLDNGASLILTYCKKTRPWIPLGANEETRSGRLLIDDSGNDILFPVVVIDDSPLKRLLENAVGVGQSVVDGFMRSTSLLIGGRRVLVIGYGNVGRGVADKFRAMGAHTYVYDADPVYLLKAKADGHHVSEDMEELLRKAEVVVTVTGRFHILRKEHLPLFRDGAILCNAGHFGFEIDAEDLRGVADTAEDMGNGRERLRFGDKSIFILENASPLNLSAGDGNPISIMDLGLGLQAVCAQRLTERENGLCSGPQAVPKDIDDEISRAMLKL